MSEGYCPYCMTPIEEGTTCPTCGLTAGTYVPASHHLPLGTVLLGRYLVGRVLGEGGFGITYIGRDLRLDLKVAIKEYYPMDRATRHAASSLMVSSPMGAARTIYEEGKERFLREARTMARMDKQQVIVGVRDYFEENNTAYIVMEYIEGVTFSELIEQRGGRIEPEELFRIIEPLFSALSDLHAKGLIHRDISPENLMLENGRVRLLDFGCARVASVGSETLTVALKYDYAPPEQYSRRGQGPWTDIYALCATIYKCLTGEAPATVADRNLGDELIPPTKRGVRITPMQESALMRGMRLQPKRRIQSAQELWAALYEKRDEPVPGPRPEPAPEPVPEPEPVPNPGPRTVFASDTDSVPVPGPEPVPDPKPVTDHTVDPMPDPEPKPVPEPKPIDLVEPSRPRWLVPVVGAAAAIALGLGLLAWHPWAGDAGTTGQESSWAATSEAGATAFPRGLAHLSTADLTALRDTSELDDLLSQNLDERFPEAQDVSTAEEFLQAVKAETPVRVTAPIEFERNASDPESSNVDVTVPVLIAEGGSLAMSEPPRDEGGGWSWLVFLDLVVNRGSLRGCVNLQPEATLVNLGVLGSVHDDYAGCVLWNEGTVVNDSEACTIDGGPSGTRYDGVFYNRGAAFLNEFRALENARVINRGELTFGAWVDLAPSVPLLNEEGATLRFENDFSTFGSPVLVNLGTVEAGENVNLDGMMALNEGSLSVASYASPDEFDKPTCISFGSGAFDVPSQEVPAYAPARVDEQDVVEVANAEELAAALEGDAAGIRIAGEVVVDDPLTLDRYTVVDGALTMEGDVRLTVQNATLELGDEGVVMASDLVFVDGAVATGGTVRLRDGGSLKAIASLVAPHELRCDGLANTRISLDEQAVLLWAGSGAAGVDADVRGGSVLSLMGDLRVGGQGMGLNGAGKQGVDLSEGSTLTVQDGMVRTSGGGVALSKARLELLGESFWRSNGGSLTLSGCDVSIERDELEKDARMEVAHAQVTIDQASSISNEGVLRFETQGRASDEWQPVNLTLSRDSRIDNSGELWLNAERHQLWGTIQNDGIIYTHESELLDGGDDAIVGDAPVAQPN